MGNPLRRTAVLGLAVAAVAAAALVVRQRLAADDADSSGDASDAASAPGTLAARETLSAAAREEASRLRRFPGLASAPRGTGAVVGKVAVFVPGAGQNPLAGASVEIAAVD